MADRRRNAQNPPSALQTARAIQAGVIMLVMTAGLMVLGAIVVAALAKVLA